MKANYKKDASEVVIADDQFRELRFNLLHTCSWLNNGMRQFLAPHDITPKQYNILRILHDRMPDSLSIQEIRDMLADKMSDASRLVDRLEKKDLLDKFPSDEDRRSNRARISAKGQRLLRDIRRDKDRLDRMISERLSDDEVNRLNSLLDRLK